MKTLIVFILLSASCFAQQLQDFDKAKVRMRITVRSFTLKGAVCGAGRLGRNKLGKEVLDNSTSGGDPFAAGGATNGTDPFGSSSDITIIDLATQPIKVGDTRDVTLYPVEPLSPEKKLYAYNVTNALLATQGKFVQSVTLTLVEKMGFEALLTKDSDGNIRMQRADSGASPFGGVDDFLSNGIVTIMGTPRTAKSKLYPTASAETYALTAQDALKTWQAKP